MRLKSFSGYVNKVLAIKLLVKKFRFYRRHKRLGIKHFLSMLFFFNASKKLYFGIMLKDNAVWYYFNENIGLHHCTIS